MHDVVYDSFKLCGKLSEDIETAATEYDTNFPHEQSPFIKKCLHELRRYASLFNEEILRQNADENYYNYLGMVESLRREISVNAQHNEEKTELLRLLDSHIFNKHFLDRQEIFNAFEAAKNAGERYKEDDINHIRQTEIQQYQQALQAYNAAWSSRLNAQTPAVLRDVYECGRELELEIEEDRTSYVKRNREHEFDFKYFTHMLRDAGRVRLE